MCFFVLYDIYLISCMCFYILVGCKWPCSSAIQSAVIHFPFSCSKQPVSLVDLFQMVLFTEIFYIDVDCEFLDGLILIKPIWGHFPHCIFCSLFVLSFVYHVAAADTNVAGMSPSSTILSFHFHSITISILKTMVCLFFIQYQRHLNFCGCLGL